eukprot:scaffold8732_cov133-Isochrysis_galbana.AAC.7
MLRSAAVLSLAIGVQVRPGRTSADSARRPRPATMCRRIASLHRPYSLPDTAVETSNASFEPIGAYQPASQVTDHNALDQDQAAIEAVLSKVPVAYGQARSVYTEGGNSRAISVLTIPALTTGMSKGVAVKATGEDGNPVSGAVWLAADTGSTQISVVYDVSDVQANHVRCRVGGLPVEFQRRDGCIDTNKTVTIGPNSMQVLQVALDLKNAS